MAVTVGNIQAWLDHVRGLLPPAQQMLMAEQFEKVKVAVADAEHVNLDLATSGELFAALARRHVACVFVGATEPRTKNAQPATSWVYSGPTAYVVGLTEVAGQAIARSMTDDATHRRLDEDGCLS